MRQFKSVLKSTCLQPVFGIILTLVVLLMMTNHIFSTPDGKSYNIVQAAFMLRDGTISYDSELTTISAVYHTFGNWVALFAPMLAAMPIVISNQEDKKGRIYRQKIAKTTRIRFYLAKLSGGMISGGMVLLTGYLLCVGMILFLYPSIQATGEDCYCMAAESYIGIEYFTVKAFLLWIAGRGFLIFVYGVLNTLPAIVLSAIVDDPYTILSVVFFVKYMISCIAEKWMSDYITMGTGNPLLWHVANIIYPDAILQSGILQSYWLPILILSFTGILALSIIYLILQKGKFDCGE